MRPDNRSKPARRQGGFTLIELLIVVAIIGIIASLAIPNLRDAMDRAKQNGTMANMTKIGNALEMYSVDHNVYPKGLTDADAGAIAAYLSPLYLRAIPNGDEWDNAWHIDTNASGTQYTITSYGRDGAPGINPGGQTADFNCDIIFSNGMFYQKPK
jgi:general secretion pathway protein G